ncbi:MAG: type II secretion system F family protein [Candidatus Dormibacteraceae bacterium]
MIISPLIFYAEIVFVLALAGLATAWLLYDAEQRPAPSQQWQRFLERQRDLATNFGGHLRRWLLLRGGVAALGFLGGSLTSLWTAALLGAGLGWFGFPWLLGGRMAKRRLALERAAAALGEEVSNLMQQSNLSLDRALRETARNPVPELAMVLAPLRSDQSIPDCLCEVSRLSRSPLVDLLSIGVMVARTHDPAAFVKVFQQVLKPILEVAIGVQEENQATVAQQRTAAIAVGVVMGILMLSVMRVPSMHDFYSSLPGQLVLFFVVLSYLGLVWLIGQIAKPITWTTWSVAQVKAEMELLLG